MGVRSYTMSPMILLLRKLLSGLLAVVLSLTPVAGSSFGERAATSSPLGPNFSAEALTAALANFSGELGAVPHHKLWLRLKSILSFSGGASKISKALDERRGEILKAIGLHGIVTAEEQTHLGMSGPRSSDRHALLSPWVHLTTFYPPYPPVTQRDPDAAARTGLFDAALGALQVVIERPTDEAVALLDAPEDQLRHLLEERAAASIIVIVEEASLSVFDRETIFGSTSFDRDASRPYETLLRSSIPARGLKMVLAPEELAPLARATIPGAAVIPVPTIPGEITIYRRVTMPGYSYHRGRSLRLSMPDYQHALAQILSRPTRGVVLMHAVRLPAAEDLAVSAPARALHDREKALDMTWLRGLVMSAVVRLTQGAPGLGAWAGVVAVGIPLIEQGLFATAGSWTLIHFPRFLWIILFSGTYAYWHPSRPLAFRLAAGAWSAASLLVAMTAAYFGGISAVLVAAVLLAGIQTGIRKASNAVRWSLSAILGGGSGLLLAILSPTRWVDGSFWLLFGSMALSAWIVRTALSAAQAKRSRPRVRLRSTEYPMSRREIILELLNGGSLYLAAWCVGRLEQAWMYRQKVVRAEAKLKQAAEQALARLENHPEIFSKGGVDAEQAQEVLSALRTLIARPSFVAFRERALRHQGFAFIDGRHPDTIHFDTDLVSALDASDLESTIVHEELHRTSRQRQMQDVIGKILSAPPAIRFDEFADSRKHAAALNAEMEYKGEQFEDAYEDSRLNADVAAAYERRAREAPRAVAYHFRNRAAERRANVGRSDGERRFEQLRSLLSHETSVDRLLRRVYQTELNTGRTSAATFEDWIRHWIDNPAYYRLTPDDLRGDGRPLHPASSSRDTPALLSAA
jgi:hypothetical protein